VGPAGALEIVANSGSSPRNNSLMGSMLNYINNGKVNGRIRNIALIFFFLSLAAVFLILGKRQHIKRILSIMFRLKTSQAALGPSN